ncbi:MAG TPA: NAD(P)H-dependent oxidoreductase [Solirubrobacteraceae bacterium]|jgi:chromate reductase
MTPFTVVGVAGSLRHDSYNRALLRAAAELAPDDVTFTIFDLDGVPLYDEDHDEYRGGDHMPDAVVALREAISAADAVVLACPEYNWGPSGVLKNAIDWASRPPAESPLRHKPVALIGCSGGPAGTGRAQLQTRQHLQSLKAYTLPEPDVQIGFAKDRFDDDLALVDDDVAQLLRDQLDALRRWAAALRNHG